VCERVQRQAWYWYCFDADVQPDSIYPSGETRV